MIHLGAFDGRSSFDTARHEIEIYLRHGIYPLIENYLGSAEECEEVLAWMQQAHPDAVYGINILGDYVGAFELARQYGAKFLQIDSVCGHLSPEKDEEYAEQLKACRRNSDVVLLGGVRFKYKDVRSGRSVEEDLRLGMQRCDAIVCTGEGTGLATPFEKLDRFKHVVGDFPVVVGAGVTLETAGVTAQKSDGAIVGSWFKTGHDADNPVKEGYVKLFVEMWKDQTVRTDAEWLYLELMVNYEERNKEDLGEDMSVINVLPWRYWKPYYLVDHRAKKAYRWLGSGETLQTVSLDDIDWDKLKAEKISESVLARAENLSFHFPSFIYKYDQGVAVVKWQLNPDGMYYMDSDGYGMTDDVEFNIYGVIDRTGKVVVKFRPIKKHSETDDMMEEAKAQLNKKQ